ncbi:MAG: hypothetical protein ACIPMY_00925 [Rickettsia endosymbiont of Pentastiridius leporinus]
MLKNFIFILFCVGSYKALAENKKLENDSVITQSFNCNDSLAEKKKKPIKEKELKLISLAEIYPDYLEKNPKNIEPLVNNNIECNFEGLERTGGDDIITARQRNLIENSWIVEYPRHGGSKSYYFNFGPVVKEEKTLDEKIQDKLRELYIQQIKPKKSSQ